MSLSRDRVVRDIAREYLDRGAGIYQRADLLRLPCEARWPCREVVSRLDPRQPQVQFIAPQGYSARASWAWMLSGQTRPVSPPPGIRLRLRLAGMVFATLRELRDERGKTLAMCWSEGAWSKRATARSYSPIPVSAGSFLADDYSESPAKTVASQGFCAFLN